MPKKERFSVDDRGNVAEFYELYSGVWEKVACLNREAGPPEDCDAITSWDGDTVVTKWACKNGYKEEIDGAVKI